MEFNKQPLSYIDQAKVWESRGLIITDKARAIRYLTNVSYYRLSAYAIPLQTKKDVFNKGTTFDDILNLYIFDRELRLLVFNAIERIEIAVRSVIIQKLAIKYGSHWQDNRDIFKSAVTVVNKYTQKEYIFDVYDDIQKIIRKSVNERNPETFIKHYKNNYIKPKNPPSWMCIEILTLGQLSRLFDGLKYNIDKTEIANHFNLNHAVFKSWLHNLTYIRNISCHHGRLWNREFAIPAVWPKNIKCNWLSNEFKSVASRPFYTFSIIKYLLNTVNPTHQFKENLKALITKYPNTPIKYMGIPSVDGKSDKLIKWEEQDLWR